MGTAFDPYHRWLGIPPAEQPATLYRLLGLRVFEDDPDVIENAADQRLAHLRTFQAGKHSGVCVKLLNEVTSAKVTLLTPQKKAHYDQQLHAQLGPQQAAPMAVPVATTAPPPLPAAAATRPQDELYGVSSAERVSIGAKMRTGRRRSNSAAALVGTALVVAIAIGAAAFVLLRNEGPPEFTETALLFNWPADARQGAVVTVDGKAVDVPATGPWHYPCQPGDHEVEITRPGYDPVHQRIRVEAGQSRGIEVVWVKTPGKETPVGPTAERDLARRRPVDLLPHVDPAADGVSGSWTREGSRLLAVSERDACLALPVRIEAMRYVLQTRFSPKRLGSVELCLPCGSRRFNMVVAEKEVQLSKADGQIISKPLPSSLAADATQQVDIEVRRGSDETEIRLSLGGLSIFSWKGDENVLTGWRLADRRRPALGAHAAEVVFETARLVILDGSATWIEGREKPFPVTETPVAVAQPPEKPTPSPNDQRPVTVVDQPTSTPPPEVESPEPPKQRLALPTDQQQQSIRTQLEEIYKLSEADTPQRKRDLARELARVGEESLKRPTERFVLLDTAVQLAGAGGDAALMLDAAGKLTDAYELDATKYRADAVVALARAADDATVIQALYSASEDAIDQALDEGRYDLAAAVAEAVNRACQQPKGANFRKRAYDRQQRIDAQYQQWKQGQDALAALKVNADDPEANLAAGRWYCLGPEDWQQGLPCLAKGSDAKLKALAAKDLAASPGDAAGRIAVGDAWWDAAEETGNSDKHLMLARAQHWYKLAHSGDIASLLAMKVDKRLEQIASVLDQDDDGASASPNAGLFKENKFVDLIPYIDVTRDTVGGSWLRISDDVTVGSGSSCRLALPFTLQGSYDFEVDFVRTEGEGRIAMIFPVGYKQIALVFSVDEGKCNGLELLDGRSADDRRNPSTRKPGIIQNGRRYTALVGVRVKGDKATIDVVFNGKKYMRTYGTLDGLSLPTRWDLRNTACAGLGADQAAVKFSKARIRMIDGKASPLPR